MKQYKVYENYIAESFNLPMLDHPDALWQTGVIINEAVHIANNLSKPVHINFPFREPLYEMVINQVDNYSYKEYYDYNRKLESEARRKHLRIVK